MSVFKGTVLRHGTLCFAGHTDVPIWKGDTIIGYCSTLSPVLTVLYMLTHAVKNISQVYLIKEGTATLSMTIEMIQIPFSALVFSIPYIGTEVFSWYDILGLSIVCAGFALYAYFGKEFRDTTKQVLGDTDVETEDVTKEETEKLIN
jgi:CRT-like, chloroquine-resistance transporter-like